MVIEIEQKRPISFGIKVAIIVIAASIVLGGLLRITDNKSSVSNVPRKNNPTMLGTSGNIIIPVIMLPVNVTALEKEWNASLANQINGQSEVQVDRGRVDVMTDAYAIEIDFFKKWHEGLGQAIHYGDASNRIGVLALIERHKEHETDVEHMELLRKIERLCIEKGVKLILLRSL